MEISFSFVGLQSHIGNQIVILPKSVLRFFHSLQYKLPRSLGFSLQERLLKNDTTESCCEQASNQAYREFLGVKRIVQYIFSMTINKGTDSIIIAYRRLEYPHKYLLENFHRSNHPPFVK